MADNGVMYRTDKKGLIPSLLTKWFDERVEYRKLAKKFAEDGNDENMVTLIVDNIYRKFF